jgi:hypothetical protein
MRRTRRNRKRNGTRTKKGGGWFDSFFGKPKVITKDDDSILFLEPVGGDKNNVWSSVYLPPYIKTIESAKNICNRIDDIIKGVNTNGLIVRCNFTKRIKDRIAKIQVYNNNVKKQLASLKSTDSFDYEQLFSNFKEAQMYIVICKIQSVERGVGAEVIGKFGKVATSLL